MKILIIPEISEVCRNLAPALRQLGHEVTVVGTQGAYGTCYSDIDMSRSNPIAYAVKLLMLLPRLRGYDIVMITTPLFLLLKRERLLWVYKYLRRHNRHVVYNAVGEDYYFTNITKTQRPFRYSDYHIGSKSRSTSWGEAVYEGWNAEAGRKLTKEIVTSCDAIIAGLYEYWKAYTLCEDKDTEGRLPKDKLSLIPLPFTPLNRITPPPSEKMRIFVGISPRRSDFKGTDVMLKAAEDLKSAYPNEVDIKVAKGVAYEEYVKMMGEADVAMDQLYSYTPAMNALLSLSKGIITFTGGEPEHYESIGETECKPIVNTEPTYEAVYDKLEWLLHNRDKWENLKQASHDYVVRNHDSMKVARQYDRIFKQIVESGK